MATQTQMSHAYKVLLHTVMCLLVTCRLAILSLLYAALSSFFLECQAAVITGFPQANTSVIVPIYATANFTCEGNGSILNWLVQSAELTESIEQEREITVNTTNNGSNFSSVLTVKAQPINDNLTVGCEVITYNPFHRALMSSQLTIRGISSVENLRFKFSTNNSLAITWSSPVYYSNDIIPITSNWSYQVLVSNEKGDTIINSIVTNTNIIEVNDTTQCDTFIIFVTALVNQYTSDERISTHNGSYHVDVVYIAKDHGIIFQLSSTPSQDCEKKLFVKDMVDNSILINEIHFNYQSIVLQPQKLYQLLIIVKNLRNTVKDIKCKNISTFNVQDLVLSSEGYTNGSVSVQCVFVPELTADGCQVIFTHVGSGTNESFNITGPNATIISLSSSGNYSVTGYDISNKSIYGPAVYYPKIMTVVSSSRSTSLSSISEIGTSNIISSSLITPDPSTTFNTVMSTISENSATVIGDCIMAVIILIFVAVLII